MAINQKVLDNKILDLTGRPGARNLGQGPLKKWTEHSHELHFLKIHSRGAPITPRGWMGVDFLGHELL